MIPDHHLYQLPVLLQCSHPQLYVLPLLMHPQTPYYQSFKVNFRYCFFPLGEGGLELLEGGEGILGKIGREDEREGDVRVA